MQRPPLLPEYEYCSSEHRTKIREDSEIVIKVIHWQTQCERVANWQQSANLGGEWV